MNASVAQWLTATGAIRGSYRVSQGSRVGRAGGIVLTVDDDRAVWVGGATTTCIPGTITL
jgi:predicted PhzF superfamily epimerase YddE/YHI9